MQHSRPLFILLLMSISLPLASQNYDEGFSKPIVTENGKFVYHELPPINTDLGTFVFLDRNLGAGSIDLATSDSWGDLYQWGRPTDGHEKRLSQTIPQKAETVTSVHHGMFILDDIRSNNWVEHSTGSVWQTDNPVNNPCPCGYRIPTQAEWQAVLALGYKVYEKQTGYYVLSLANGILELPAAGLRNAHNGYILHSGTRGYYWAQDAITEGTSGTMDFNSEDRLGNISLYGYRAFGRSIRCVRKVSLEKK